MGANVEEAQAAQSKKDFISKMSIASKEARETRYWLLLLKQSGLGPRLNSEIDELLIKINEIINILVKIIKSSRLTK